VLQRVTQKASRVWANWTLQRSMTHRSGAARVTLGPTEAGLVILARNAEWYLHDCLAHHFALGLRHVVLIDNGSNDRTVEIAAAFANVKVLSCLLPAKRHEVGLRALAARRVFAGGWVAFADTDEMLELPAPLPRLLDYANGGGHTAILGQMLDMSAATLGVSAAGQSYAEARSEAAFYTLEGLEWVPYADPSFHTDWFLRSNRLSDPNVRMVAGGLRKIAFGEDPILTKHTLVRNLPGVELMSHVHAAGNVVVSDVTLAILHYKLAGDWRARDSASVSAKLWEHGEDERRLAISSRPDFRFDVPAAHRWVDANTLLREGFLYASDAARQALAIKS
jgi:hypothetical protein